jgi:hypothetical protein
VQSVSTTTKLRQKFYAQAQRRSFHTAWVNRVALTVCRALPFSPGERTSQARGLRSEKCQIQTLSTLAGASLDDARLSEAFHTLSCCPSITSPIRLAEPIGQRLGAWIADRDLHCPK